MNEWGLRICSAVATACLVAVGLAPQPANATPPWCDGGGPIQARELPAAIPQAVCDLRGRTIANGAAKVVVGPVGTGVFSEALLGDSAGADVLDVYTDTDGTVGVQYQEDVEDDNTGESLLDASECNDGAYNHNGVKESQQHQFRIKKSSIPSRNNADATIDGVRAGGANITGQDNNCGFADQVSAQIAYEGTTSKSANLNNGACVGFASKDETNVVDFGLVAKKSNGGIVVGITCNWYVYNGYNELVESDVRLNKSHALFYNSGSCDGEYHIESVMTHERGHTFGMGHPGDNHSNLTMYRSMKKCSKAYSSLGWGDVRGLRAIY